MGYEVYGGGPNNPWPCPVIKTEISNNCDRARNVNLSSFGIDAILTRGSNQYAVFVNSTGDVIAAKRTLPDGSWSTADTTLNVDTTDGHHTPVIALDENGIIHVACNFHDDPITGRYARSDNSEDITTWTQFNSWTGSNENVVTYPIFFWTGTELLLTYRNGASGDGELYMNKWNGSAWIAEHHPLINNVAADTSPYWDNLVQDSNGDIHLSWCWRDSELVSTNHDYCYAIRKASDGNWYKSDETTQYTLPILEANSDIFDPIPTSSGLVNQNALALDSSGNPHVAYEKEGSKGFINYVHSWLSEGTWTIDVIPDFRQLRPVDLTGGEGVIKSRPDLLALNTEALLIVREYLNGALYIIRGIDGTYKWYRVGDELWGLMSPLVDRYRWNTDGSQTLTIIAANTDNASGETSIFSLDIDPNDLLKESFF